MNSSCVFIFNHGYRGVKTARVVVFPLKSEYAGRLSIRNPFNLAIPVSFFLLHLLQSACQLSIQDDLARLLIVEIT